MEMTTVSSSFISAVGFEPDSADQPDTGTVMIRFNDGAEFNYAGVSLADFEALKNASSVGRFFHSVWKRKYNGVRA